MKYALLFIALLMARPVAAQNPDPASILDLSFSITKPVHAATVDSGTRVDRAGYAGAMMTLLVGQADNVTSTQWVVLIDSIAGTAAWQLADSVAVDSVDNKMYKLTYKRTNRWIRILLRSSGNAADTFAVNGFFTMTNKRKR